MKISQKKGWVCSRQVCKIKIAGVQGGRLS